MAKLKKHPGVTLLKPEPACERRSPKTGKLYRSGAIGWRLRFKDPDSGKLKKITLDHVESRSRASRNDAAVRKSDEIAGRRLELEQGATPASGVPIDDAMDRYFGGHRRQAEGTHKIYRGVADKFELWAASERIATCDDLNRGRLMGFRESILHEPKHARAAHRTIPDEPRSEFTVNKDLRAASAILRYLCDKDLFARLSMDDIRRALKRIETKKKRKDYLKPRELRKFFEAALRYDGGHEGPPIAPFALYLALTGCRLGEALRVQWPDIDFEDGEIQIGTDSKTGEAREVDFAPSPALRRLMQTRRLQTGKAKGAVWELTEAAWRNALGELKAEYAAPKKAGAQILRVTCQSYLASAPAIYQAASIFLAAKRGGHSVAVCEKHYAGNVKNIPATATSIEAAMRIEDLADKIIRSVSSPSSGTVIARVGS